MPQLSRLFLAILTALLAAGCGASSLAPTVKPLAAGTVTQNVGFSSIRVSSPRKGDDVSKMTVAFTQTHSSGGDTFLMTQTTHHAYDVPLPLDYDTAPLFTRALSNAGFVHSATSPFTLDASIGFSYGSVRHSGLDRVVPITLVVRLVFSGANIHWTREYVVEEQDSYSRLWSGEFPTAAFLDDLFNKALRALSARIQADVELRRSFGAIAPAQLTVTKAPRPRRAETKKLRR
jgi:hypothetical protein